MPVYMEATPELDALVRRCADPRREVALDAQRALFEAISLSLRDDPGNGQAKALTLPLKPGILKGDTLGNIFQPYPLRPGQSNEFPLDFLTSSNVGEFVAWTIPSQGKPAELDVKGDYLMLKTYDVGANIDTHNKYIRDAGWPIIPRMMEVLEAMFTVKKNNDGWHVLLASASSRGLAVVDTAATAGLFTKRLVNLMQISMNRNGGGNQTSVGQINLTDLYMSIEAHGDILSWDATQLSEADRQSVFSSGNLMRIFGTNLHKMSEFGVNQDYDGYWQNTLGNSFTNSKVELVLGLSLPSNSFVMPMRQDLIIQENPEMPLRRRFGMYGNWEGGFSAIDNRYALAGYL